MAPPPPPPIPLFPPAPSVNLVNDGDLQKALNAAIATVTIAGKPPLFGLTIVDIGNASADAKSYASAGFNENTEHYAASMLKAACLYAAYALRDLVQRLNGARKPKDPDTLFQMLHAELDPQIAVCCPMVTARAQCPAAAMAGRVQRQRQCGRSERTLHSRLHRLARENDRAERQWRCWTLHSRCRLRLSQRSDVEAWVLRRSEQP